MRKMKLQVFWGEEKELCGANQVAWRLPRVTKLVLLSGML